MAVALVHMVQAGGHFAGLLHVMLHRQHREMALPVQPGQLPVNFSLVHEVHPCGRLVQDEKVRISHEGPGNEHPLVLSA